MEKHDSTDDYTFKRMEEIKSLLQVIRNKKIATRARVKWLQEGEKSKYFCNVENRNFINKSMTFLDREKCETTYDQTEMLSEVKEF